MKRMGTWLLVAGLSLFSLAARAADVLVIVDSSASMSEPTSDGKAKIEAAKAALLNLRPSLAGHEVGLVLFGHSKSPREGGSCQDIEQVLPMAPFSSEAFASVVANLAPRGSTPLANSLLKSQTILQGRNSDSQKEVILVTDGNETCGGDPIAVAEQMRALGINVRIHVVGFAVSQQDVQQLTAIAARGGGEFASANNTQELSAALTNVVKSSTRQAAPHFVEEFDGDELGESWSVVNADQDLFIVEDGKLLAVAASPGKLAEETVENIFSLNQPLPQGNWVATMKFNIDVQTAAETVVFGLYDDKDNFTLAELYFIMTWGGELRTHLGGVNRARGKETRLLRERVWFGPGGSAVDQAKSLPSPLFLRVEKKGRSYLLSARLGDEKTDAEWIDIGKLTALRAKGGLAFGFTQHNEKVTGESTMEVDWVKVETLE